MVVAPAAAKFAVFNVIPATPAELVSAVPLLGFIVAKDASVLNVTTALATGAPAALVKVALTNAGAVVEIEFAAAPVTASVRASVKFAAGGAGGTTVVPVGPVELLMPPAPGLQPVKMANNAASKKDNESPDIVWRKNEFCMQAPLICLRNTRNVVKRCRSGQFQ